MAKLIKKASTAIKFNVGDKVKYARRVPEQGIGTCLMAFTGKIVKLNRVTVDVLDDANGDTWRVDLHDVVEVLG